MKVRLCYRIEKDAWLGEDAQGNPTEVYSCVKMNCTTYNIPKEEYKELVTMGRVLTAINFSVDKNLVTPVTLNEYLDNTEEDWEEYED